MTTQMKNQRNNRNRQRRQGLRVSIWVCVAFLIIALLGCAFGVYGMNLAKNANIASASENDIQSLNSNETEFLSDWSIFHEVGLHYDTLYPLDLECEAAFLELDGRGRVQLVETIWLYGNKWKAEMERYLDLLITELNENGVIWEVGFEQIEKERGGLGWMAAEAQEAWEAYNASNAMFNDFIRGQINHGGTIMQNYRAGYRYDSYRSRALYIKSLYEFITRW